MSDRIREVYEKWLASEIMLPLIYADEVADIIVGSLGRTHGQMMLASTQALYPPGHPERCFVEWLNDNQGRLAEAGAELGVLPGPRLYSRLKAAYIERQEASDAIPPVR